jgi:hypothetical protein
MVNTLVHEAAHIALPGEPDHTEFGDAARAQALANMNPALALKNASNYAHFVTNDPNLPL